MLFLSSSITPDIVVSPIFKEASDMEKKQFQSVDQYGEMWLENYIDWSIAYSKDEVSSDEENIVEPTIKWIIGGKRKRLAEEEQDQQPVKELIINVQHMKPTQLSMKQHRS